MIVINTGATANDGTGDKLRDAFIIVNQNFLDIQNILDVVLTDSSIIPISQISGLQTILDDLSYQVSLIPTLQDDINSINSTIFTINQTLNSQNSSINELYSLVNDLQQQIFTKIGEAPIDGQQYVRKDGEWSVVSGVTFSQLLENVTPDSYLGLRLQPASASNNGFYINKSTNQSVGYYVRNTDNVGNGAVSALYLGGSGGLYDNYVSLFHANAGYYIPYLRNNNGLISNNDLFFIGWQGASFNFVTSTGTFGNETSKFKITNSGTVSIGVQPTLDNDTTDILGRKADGTIVRIDKSSIVGTGITAINNLVGTTQSLVTGTAGTNFTISSTGSTHTFNLPTASATNRGALSSADWTIFNSKQNNLKTFNRTQGIYYFEEFMGYQAGGLLAAYSNVITLVSGNGTARSVGTTNRTNQQGIIQHSTGTAATNFAGYAYGSSLYIGSGTISIETYVTIDTLSNATQRFFTYFGYAGGNSNYLNIPSGIFFSYDEGGVVFSGGIATPNWKCYTRAASGAVTVTTTSIPVVDGQWYKLRIDINAGGTSVTFYVDGVLVATHTTNIPSSTTAIAPISIICKSAGTTARTMLTDYFMYEEIFTNAR